MIFVAQFGVCMTYIKHRYKEPIFTENGSQILHSDDVASTSVEIFTV